LKRLRALSFFADIFSLTRRKAEVLDNGGRAMDAHYKGHHIRFTVIRNPCKATWTFSAVSIGGTGTQESVKVFILEHHEFRDAEKATARGLLFVTKWIEKSTPEVPFDLVVES
jgi:hypothetical protein